VISIKANLTEVGNRIADILDIIIEFPRRAEGEEWSVGTK
jgi:hypothetical protein